MYIQVYIYFFFVYKMLVSYATVQPKFPLGDDLSPNIYLNEIKL